MAQHNIFDTKRTGIYSHLWEVQISYAPILKLYEPLRTKPALSPKKITHFIAVIDYFSTLWRFFAYYIPLFLLETINTPILMSYQNGLNKLPKGDRNQLNKIVSEWRRHGRDGQIHMDNLQNERFLPALKMKSLQKDIIKCYSKCTAKSKKEKIKQTRSQLQKEFYRKYQRQGGRIKSRNPKYIGTVLPFDDFMTCIQIRLGGILYSDEDDLWKALRYFKEYNYLPPELKVAMLRDPDWLLWLTWDNENDNPFSFVRYGREELITALGLGSKSYSDKALIAFVFRYSELCKNSSAALYRPTFCDADFNIHFRPAINTINHGMTHPLNNGTLRNGHKTHPRPEAVEKSYFFTLDSLSQIEEYP